MISIKHIALAASLALASCSHQQDTKPVENETIKEAVELGREHADKAIKASPGSMERERAILQIRANEQKIRESGDAAAADAYARAAEERLDSAAII